MAKIEAKSLQKMFQGGRKDRRSNYYESAAEVKLGLGPTIQDDRTQQETGCSNR